PRRSTLFPYTTLFRSGMDADPAKANLFGVLEKKPELARDGIHLRQFGQQIIERLGGKRIHPSWVVPGGVSEPLTELNRDAILARSEEHTSELQSPCNL